MKRRTTTGKRSKPLTTRQKKKLRLVTKPEDIRELTGHWSYNVRPRCSGCKKPTMKATVDFGKEHNPRYEEIARYCPRCDVIFPLKKRVIATYD